MVRLSRQRHRRKAARGTDKRWEHLSAKPLPRLGLPQQLLVRAPVGHRFDGRPLQAWRHAEAGRTNSPRAPSLQRERSRVVFSIRSSFCLGQRTMAFGFLGSLFSLTSIGGREARRTHPIPFRTRKLSAWRRKYPSGEDSCGRFFCAVRSDFCQKTDVLTVWFIYIDIVRWDNFLVLLIDRTLRGVSSSFFIEF